MRHKIYYLKGIHYDYQRSCIRFVEYCICKYLISREFDILQSKNRKLITNLWHIFLIKIILLSHNCRYWAGCDDCDVAISNVP